MSLDTLISFHDAQPTAKRRETTRWLSVEEAGVRVVIYLTPARCRDLAAQLLAVAGEETDAQREGA